LFERAWWQLYEPDNGKDFPPFEYILASLDSAYTEREENDPSALTVWGVFRNDKDQRRIMLIHAWRKHLQFSADRSKIVRGEKESGEAWQRRTRVHWGLIEWVVATCLRFKVDKLLIEAKASGISAAQELANRFGQQTFGVQLVKVTGDKYSRALAVQPTFSQLLVYAPERDWADLVMSEMEVFPRGKYKDLTDSATQAIKYLRDVGLAQTDDETHVAEMEAVTLRQKPKPLYPV
jgi:predicted phage terminase large subunit-like protein